MRMRGVVLAAALAGCGGGGGATVEGTFAPGAAVPDGVWIVESQRSEPADSAGFRVRDLSPGPVQMRLLRGGDTVGVLNLGSLPDGARAVLGQLRVDPSTGLAFPRSVELDGADVVMVNGLRMGPADRIPAKVDAAGAVLGWFPKSGALLLRPADASLPDLRVVVSPETVVEGADGGAGNALTLGAGDSVRVEGTASGGHVMATRLIVPAKFSAGMNAEDADEVAARDGSGVDEEGERVEGGTSAASGSTSPASVPIARASAPRASAPSAPLRVPRPDVPIARPPAMHENGNNGNGNGNGRGRGREKEPRGRGNGNGNGNGGKGKG